MPSHELLTIGYSRPHLCHLFCRESLVLARVSTREPLMGGCFSHAYLLGQCRKTQQGALPTFYVALWRYKLIETTLVSVHSTPLNPHYVSHMHSCQTRTSHESTRTSRVKTQQKRGDSQIDSESNQTRIVTHDFDLTRSESSQIKTRSSHRGLHNIHWFVERWKYPVVKRKERNPGDLF